MAAVAGAVTGFVSLSRSRANGAERNQTHLEAASTQATARLYWEMFRQQLMYQPSLGTASAMVLSVLIPVASAALSAYAGLRLAGHAGGVVGAGVGVVLAFFILMLTGPFLALRAGRQHQKPVRKEEEVRRSQDGRPGSNGGL